MLYFQFQIVISLPFCLISLFFSSRLHAFTEAANNNWDYHYIVPWLSLWSQMRVVAVFVTSLHALHPHCCHLDKPYKQVVFYSYFYTQWSHLVVFHILFHSSSNFWLSSHTPSSLKCTGTFSSFSAFCASFLLDFPSSFFYQHTTWKRHVAYTSFRLFIPLPPSFLLRYNPSSLHCILCILFLLKIFLFFSSSCLVLSL